ncbi:MAG: hypothetical protein QOD24_4499 [Solirubrobacteraceae bacterium]|jgi:hypothetical protein|nr:hypothetical protein [Solirubrobacteraceae bacterium]
MLARYTWAESGEPAGEEPRFVHAVIRDERLERFQVGHADAEAALSDAGLSRDDEITVDDSRSA